MPKEIKLERTFAHPIEKVWEAISTSEALAAWLMPNDFELKKGHKFQFLSKPQAGFDGTVNCEVIDFAAPSRLQITWQGGPMKTPTLITFELTEIPQGTRLKFTQSGFKGFVNEYIVRFILGSGWKKLLKKKLYNYLAK